MARIQANDNRVPAGVLQNGVLTLQLDVVRATWYPDRDDEPGIDVPAFAEAGHAPSAPGPLIRVPRGTEIRTTIRNTLADSSIVVVGLSGERTLADSVRIQPGETRELVTRASTAGTFLYFACTALRTVTTGDDHLLRGAFVVDEPGARVNDRIIVLLQYVNQRRMKPFPGTVNEINTFNGKTWPSTERLTYDVHDTIRWRIINGSMQTHAMHLHGAYFTVLSRGNVAGDSTFAVAQRPEVVTERLPPFTTMQMQWTPVHAGNWIFHCHITPHIRLHPPLGPMKASDSHGAMGDMAGMVMGVIVHGPIAADPKPVRDLRLVVQQFDSIPGEAVVPFSYSLDHDAAAPHTPGPTLFLTRGQATAITVVNHTRQPTAVHWHGLEIQSFYDGVHGFGGHDMQLAPHIMPNDSFRALLTPPRAGTFMYHTHFNEAPQQRGGLYGALIVLNPGEKWDPAHEVLVMISNNRGKVGELAINGEDSTTFHMVAGRTYRLRLMQIHVGAPNLVLSVTNGEKLLQWRMIARDGFDIPAKQTTVQPSTLIFGPGQTYDMLFTAPAAGTYQLRLAARTVEGDPVTSTSRIIVDAHR